jgi:hypothetical protein
MFSVGQAFHMAYARLGKGNIQVCLMREEHGAGSCREAILGFLGGGCSEGRLIS